MWASRASGASRWLLPRPLPGPQDASQTALGAPKTLPGGLQEACRSAQDVSESAQEPPRRLEDASKNLQEGQRAPKTCPRGPQEPPMEGHRGLQVLARMPFAVQGLPEDMTSRLPCEQSLSNPAASAAKALSSSACRLVRRRTAGQEVLI